MDGAHRDGELYGDDPYERLRSRRPVMQPARDIAAPYGRGGGFSNPYGHSDDSDEYDGYGSDEYDGYGSDGYDGYGSDGYVGCGGYYGREH